MFSSSVASSARAHHHHHAVDHDTTTAKGNAAGRAKHKAAASSSNKPQFASDRRYNASPMSSPSAQVRAGRATRANATPTRANATPTRANATPPRANATPTHQSPLRTPPGTPGYGTPPGTPGPSLQRLNAGRDNPVLLLMADERMASNKANRANPISHSPETVPQRLREKAEAIDLNKIKKQDQTLHEYASKVVGDALAGEAPDRATNKMDVKLLPTFAKAENSRHPDLNLHVFGKAAECYDAIRAANRDVQSSRQPSSMRVIYQPFKGMPDHHVALDVQLRPGHRPSVVAFEPSTGGTISGGLQSVLRKDFPDAKTKVVSLNTQNSNWDCVMFAMSNALKAHKHQDDYLAQLHKGQTAEVPADFLKHAHSKQRVSVSPNKNSLVTKDKVGAHKETLEHRNYAYRAQRFDHAYSTSIEGFRMQEIQRASQYLEAQGASSGAGAKKNSGGFFSFLRGNK